MEHFSKTNDMPRADADLLHDKRYNASIESIARELAVPIDDVVARYRATLATLATRATVNDYIAILVEKKVKDLYRTAIPVNHRHAPAPRYAS